MSSFAALLAASASENAAKQQALAKQEKERQAQQRKLDLENHRKAEEAKRAAEARRKEREAREAKVEEEQRLRKQALPKTNNLYQLKQERIKRGLNPDGSEDHLAGGGVAKPASKQSYSDLLKNATKSKSSGNGSTKSKPKSKGKAKEVEPVGLTREEKAARKRDALFRDDEPSSGAFALARAMKAQDEPRLSTSGSSSASTSKATTSSSTLSPRPVSSSAAPAKKKSSEVSRTSSSSSSGNSKPVAAPASSARDRLKAGFKPNDLKKLYTVKRDTRTIEEIERDLKAKKAGPSGAGSSAKPKDTTSSTNPRLSSSSGPTNSRVPSASQNRRRSRSLSSSSDSESSSSSADRRHRQKKRAKQGALNEQQRDAIWKLLGKDRSRYTERDYDSDESDMEASGSAVLAEERRAARLASREDAEEQERLRVAAEKKKQMKAARAGGGAR